MSYWLVTNDDGIDSPALLPLLRALGALAPVRAVVPSSERSWIGKAISRWEDVRVERQPREGFDIYAVDGYPADCTNLGVHSLFDERPELVISGVNIGLNTGLGFFLSSGTVGAAMEGWIAGIPSLAFSVGVQDSDRSWKPGATAPEFKPVWERAAAISADVTAGVRRDGYPPHVDLLSVNFPVDADVDTPRVVTELAGVGYDSLFRHRGDGVYVHDYSGALRENRRVAGETDIAVLRDGRVSITPVRLAHTAAIDAATRRRLERGR